MDIISVVFEANLWENSFIMNDLLPNCRYFVANEKFHNLDFYSDNNIDKHKCVLIFSSNITKYAKIKKLCEELNPIIVIHLSDEEGNKEEYMGLANYTKLLLRQYYHAKYDYSKFTNIIHIPLAYNTISNESSLNFINKESYERDYIWSFGGKYDKWDGSQIIEKLIQSDLGKYDLKNNISSQELYNLYGNSIFVPSRRGNCNLDCLRLYEATVAGAIPILVGNNEEIQNHFKFEIDNNAGWIIEDTWDKAIEHMKYLLKNKELLNKKQQQMKEWWTTRIINIKNEINKVINI